MKNILTFEIKIQIKKLKSQTLSNQRTESPGPTFMFVVTLFFYHNLCPSFPFPLESRVAKIRWLGFVYLDSKLKTHFGFIFTASLQAVGPTGTKFEGTILKTLSTASEKRFSVDVLKHLSGHQPCSDPIDIVLPFWNKLYRDC
jgi:hypothetical protein